LVIIPFIDKVTRTYKDENPTQFGESTVGY